MQTNVKITAAHMNYKVNKMLISKCRKHFKGDRENLKDDSHSGRPVKVKWHNLVESLMGACINKDTVQHQEIEIASDDLKQLCLTLV